MIRITLTLTGALAALAFSAATAQPSPAARYTHANCRHGFPYHRGRLRPMVRGNCMFSQDFSVFNAPDETFEGVVRLDTNGFGLDDHNVYVVQVISGNVAVGEQYNIFTFFRRHLGRGLQRHRRYAGGLLHHAVR